MKAIATGILAATLTTTAFAAEVTPYIDASRALEAETNSFNFGADVAVNEAFSVSAEVNTFDADSNTRFEFDGAGLDFGYAVRENVSLYLNNDFDRDWARSETTVGVKVTF